MLIETASFLDFIRSIIADDMADVKRRLAAQPELAFTPTSTGASRIDATDYFFPEISHYLYSGDTALHMAAASLSRPMAELLVSHGADCRAKNRRGAEPLHYAADGDRAAAQRQMDVIKFLISAGADLNATDKSGVMPLHRAVRRRSIAAVRALLENGANPRQPNGSGSTPLHLAVQTTGASGSGTDEARSNQAEIIKLLISCGAKSSDVDAKGKSVEQSAKSDWILSLLAAR